MWISIIIEWVFFKIGFPFGESGIFILSGDIDDSERRNSCIQIQNEEKRILSKQKAFDWNFNEIHEGVKIRISIDTMESLAIGAQVNINFPVNDGQIERGWGNARLAEPQPRSWEQWRHGGEGGGWVAFPTFPEKFRLPSASANRVALSFNFVRFTRCPIAILGSIIAFSPPIYPENNATRSFSSG